MPSTNKENDAHIYSAWRKHKDYLTWDGNDATMLYGIGEYGSQSYRIF